MPIARLAGAYVEQRWSRAAWLGRRVAVFSLILLVVALASHRFGYLATTPFFWVLAVVVCLALLALIAAAAAFQRVWYSGYRGGGDMAVAVLISAVVLAPFVLTAWWAFATAPLSDISSDLDDPPSLLAATVFRTTDMNPIVAPDAARRQTQMRAYPAITGRRYAVTFDQLSKAVEALIKERGWELTSPLPDGSEMEFTFEAIARVPVLALPSDVAVRVTDEGNATYVDMRSVSRYGPRDLGLNAALIDSFLVELDARAATLAGVAPLEGGEAEPETLEPPDQAPIPTPLER